MVEFLELKGPFVVRFGGEGRACHIKNTAREVLDFLMANEGGGFGDGDGSAETEVLEWLEDDDNWIRDDGFGHPFEWRMSIGEISDVTVTVVDGDEPPALIDYSRLNEELIEENRQKAACELIEQLCIDLNQAHDEICRMMLGTPEQVAAADWPECSSQANSIRAAERLLGKRLAKTNNWSEFQDKADCF